MHKLPGFIWIVGYLGLLIAACNAGYNYAATEEPNTNSGLSVQLFEGFYSSGPDVSSFVTCEMGELPGAGKGYWLVPNDEFSQLSRNPEGVTLGDIGGTYGPYDMFALYARFEGILISEKGKRYGHSGKYIGEIQVTKALEVSRRWVGSTYPPGIFIGCLNKEKDE
jgi:hypothetical protein